MKYIISVLSVSTAIILIAAPEMIGSAIGGAINTCLEIIIPSLFAFTVLAVYLQNSGIYKTALRPFTYPLSRLLRLDEELCAVFILSNIGGYPVGAKLLSTLVKQGRLSEDDAGRLLCFCYGSGPLFVISVVGMNVFGTAAAGAMLFGASFLTSIIIAAFICRRGKRIQITSTTATATAGEHFIGSVMSAAHVMFTVCVMITAFAAVTAIVEFTGLSKAAEMLFSFMGAGNNSAEIFPAILEISRSSSLVFADVYIFPLCAALLSFGGICVIIQMIALTGKDIPIKPFLISRIPAAAISSVLSLAGMLLPQQSLETNTVVTISAEPFSLNAVMSLCLLAMCAILLGIKKA